jgi:hypothetical protein
VVNVGGRLCPIPLQTSHDWARVIAHRPYTLLCIEGWWSECCRYPYFRGFSNLFILESIVPPQKEMLQVIRPIILISWNNIFDSMTSLNTIQKAVGNRHKWKKIRCFFCYVVPNVLLFPASFIRIPLDSKSICRKVGDEARAQETAVDLHRPEHFTVKRLWNLMESTSW